jgi:hypothetical protein
MTRFWPELNSLTAGRIERHSRREPGGDGSAKFDCNAPRQGRTRPGSLTKQSAIMGSLSDESSTTTTPSGIPLITKLRQQRHQGIAAVL